LLMKELQKKSLSLLSKNVGSSTYYNPMALHGATRMPLPFNCRQRRHNDLSSVQEGLHHLLIKTKTKESNSVALLRKRTIPTERPPLLEIEGVAWSAQRIPTAVFSVSRPEPLLFLPSSSPFVLGGLGGPRSPFTNTIYG
jgi:hypothetical protein